MIELTLPAHVVPHGATVVKRLGTKKYKLLKKIQVFCEGERIDYHPQQGNVFLSSFEPHQIGNLNETDGRTLLRVKIDENMLVAMLDNMTEAQKQELFS